MPRRSSTAASVSKVRRSKLFNSEEEDELVDRISYLPEPILCRILSFLKTNFAVQTSLLSKKWRFIWTKVPSFKFIYRVDKFTDESFEQFINHALLLNNSRTIDSFELDSGYCNPFYLRTWVTNAIDRKVRDLILNVDWNEIDFQLPYKLFTCETLETLELEFDICVDVPSFVFLPKLRKLRLKFVEFASDECLQKLLSGCPMLKHLSIGTTGQQLEDKATRFSICSPVLEYLFLEIDMEEQPDIHDLRVEINAPSLEGIYDLRVEINAPSLEELIIRGYLYKDFDMQIKNLTSLNKAYISLDWEKLSEMGSSRDSFVRAMEGLSSVKFLTLEYLCTTILTDATSKLAANFRRLTKLDAAIDCCKWDAVLDFMRCSDNLKDLILQKENPSDSHVHEVSWRNPVEVPNCLVSSLKDITFAGFQGLEDELAMIKYVLKHGSVLERLELQADEVLRRNSESKSKILKKISAFSRNSRQCKLVFP